MSVPTLDLSDPPFAERVTLDALASVRGPVERWHATDRDTGAPLTVVKESPPGPATDGEQLWPSVAWERDLRRRCPHLGLPRPVEYGRGETVEHLILERPDGRPFWDAWDDPDSGTAERYGWLTQLAELLHTLHQAGAGLERLHPGDLVLTPLGQLVLTDAAGLIPLPLPACSPLAIDATTAPELIEGGWADARTDLYHVGALLWALHLGRELGDLDFAAPGRPHLPLERIPDLHPALGRLLGKTFTYDPAHRFPSPSQAADDPSGFRELLAALAATASALGRARLEIAAWSTVGMVRGANEDAFAVLTGQAGGVGAADERALVLLADGMGGNEAGEVAAALAVATLRRTLSQQPPFAAILAGIEPLPEPPDAAAERLGWALEEANRAVYLASFSRPGCRGMGCTAEAVLLDGRRVVVGHVGDSRTYLLQRGRFTQVTRDHTTVARMIEAGMLTPEQAEHHPRRAELHEAIGGRIDVRPDVATYAVEPGDWVVVCSDGLSGQLRAPLIQSTLERAPSAELAARRLVNLANRHGAVDNVTVVVARLH